MKPADEGRELVRKRAMTKPIRGRLQPSARFYTRPKGLVVSGVPVFEVKADFFNVEEPSACALAFRRRRRTHSFGTHVYINNRERETAIF
jgi:hypothetical protein